ncbi:hypothetical protein TBLA_0A08450 [Henningerozyma blattae CBS 6284]|uniref:Secreted protein n=1 Tax=Henningerozyma blattae (strain ATCC 34711 / CBS 6284 / DSM 70876 / NBRC 10599 / NRRL Y-10934 / UCD 77-7) TaxID=1071380 RepID=I2GWY2_HENB6|nr:hypothetical protein TBLA_0A08450 [Tetrapisispora blattae CBS 6284]CCH58634.1 hypothetical protein TBLA_0A08450 [Tetrapisispora blattae CBS 6284]
MPLAKPQTASFFFVALLAGLFARCPLIETRMEIDTEMNTVTDTVIKTGPENLPRIDAATMPAAPTLRCSERVLQPRPPRRTPCQLTVSHQHVARSGAEYYEASHTQPHMCLRMPLSPVDPAPENDVGPDATLHACAAFCAPIPLEFRRALRLALGRTSRSGNHPRRCAFSLRARRITQCTDGGTSPSNIHQYK